MERPIFIVGAMRSGSTMLRLILDSHENIAIGAETGFMGALSATKVIPNWKYGREWYGRLGWSEEELDGRLHDFYAGMFERHASSQGKRRWGDKTPYHTWHIGEMARVFPDAVFLGIVRHPGAVSMSLRKRFHYTFRDAVCYWSDANVEMVRQASVLEDRFALCRYEDLVHHPEPVTREVMAWLGEPWSPNLLEHHLVQRAKGTPRLVDGHTSAREPIDPDRASQWLQTTSEDDFALLRAEASPLAAFFGYDATDPSVLSGTTPDGGALKWLPTGADLTKRRADWSDRIDFEPRGQSLPPDASAEELATRLARTEAVLSRVRSRPAVRFSDAVRRAQRARSSREFRDAFQVLRGH